MSNFMTKHSLNSSAINYEPKNESARNGNYRTLDNAPIIKKAMPKDIIAEANKDGSIFVNKNAKGKELKTAVNHEKVHLKQIKRGDLNYTDKSVIWKGKKYSRANMKEGDPNLPWEREAYKKQNKQQ